MSREREHMSKDQIDMLIDMYKCEESLWNIKHPKYYNKQSRLDAVNNIIEAMEENFGVEFTVEHITSKIQNLRSYYGRETRKALAAQKKGEDYHSLWLYYSAMDCFLKNHFTPKNQELNINFNDTAVNGEEEVDSESDSSETSENKVDVKSEPLPSLHEGKRKPPPAQEEIPVSSKIQVRHNIPKKMRFMRPGVNDSIEHEDLTFARYLANELHKIKDLRTKQLVKLKLQTIIFEAQTGQDI